MNIEMLNKSQIVLLTLLVSFVTSIATGIVTVALMSQAPPAITQTINRVVEHTVERIVPAQQVAAAAVAAPVEKTIIVKQSEAVAQAVGTVSKSVMRIVLSSDTDKTPIAIGVAVSPSMIATDNAGLKDGGAYSAILSDGTVVPLSSDAHSSGGITLLSVLISKTATTTATLTPITIASGQLQLGQVAVALTGLRSPHIATGVITSLSVDSSDVATTTAATTATALETNISLDSLSSGTPFIDADGELIGMYTIGTDSVIPATVIASLLAPAPAPTKTAN
jgi:hypothetical protein